MQTKSGTDKLFLKYQSPYGNLVLQSLVQETPYYSATNNAAGNLALWTAESFALKGLGRVLNGGKATVTSGANQVDKKAQQATDAARAERKVETNFYRDGSPATPPLLHPDIAKVQGTSPNVGDFTGLRGATMEEIVSRVPQNWTVSIQRDGKGVRFIDTAGNERIRVHQADHKAPVGSNSNSGWVLIISNGGKGKNAQYFDHNGNVGGYKDNDTHIPVAGNPVLNNGGKK